MRVLLASFLLYQMACFQATEAEVLDPDSAVNDQLRILSAAFDLVAVDVAYNLNVPDLARANPSRPRIGMLADVPSLHMPNSEELEFWEQAYGAKQIGAVAFITGGGQTTSPQSFSSFYQQWQASAARDRLLLTYAAENQDAALQVAQVLSMHYPTRHLNLYASAPSAATPAQQVEEGGRLYATAGQRWVMDSTQARDVQASVPEFAYLGQAVRRGSTSVINPKSRAVRRLAANEPAVFLKERLGDEFEASTIPEIIVPGGIALGEEAVFNGDVKALKFDGDRLWLLSAQGQKILPEADLTTWKAGFDFAARAMAIESDAIVDIDERGRVRISSALEDTDLGFAMVRIDLEPFNFVTRLDVQKSVIIDTQVEFYDDPDSAHFQVEYEVRFLQADRMRIAKTEAAIVYRYMSSDDSVLHIDSWGPSAFSLEQRTDFTGLGNSTEDVAHYAAWIALFRSIHEQKIEFTHGRYEFLKIDKTGRSTPSRI